MRDRTFILRITLPLLLGAPACADLKGPDDDPRQPITNPAEVEARLTESWLYWWYPTAHFDGGGPWLSTASFQHSTTVEEHAMVLYSSIPREPTRNQPATGYGYEQISLAHRYFYRAIATVNDGLRAILVHQSVDMGADEARAVAWGRFVQGLGYGYLSLLYDKGPVVDETTDLWDRAPEYVGYEDVLEAALGYLYDVIAVAGASTFTIPGSWMYAADEPMSSARLAQIASSFRARLRANVARTPEEREAVDWDRVLEEVNAGITSSFDYRMTGADLAINYSLHRMLGWGQMNYFVHGMADQSGRYQEWMSLPVEKRHPNLPSGAFLIQTPDLRLPQGATEAEQREHPGSRFQVFAAPGETWGRPDHGEWRWSYYREVRDPHLAVQGVLPDLRVQEMNLLAAEAHYRLGNLAAAADLINLTRVPAGLNATNADGLNTSCVPKLPDGQCGDLWEMLKWEKRLETGMDHAMLSAPWFFDSRGWGDLHEGTILQLPVPWETAMQAPQVPIRNFGGSLDWSASVGTYGY